MLGIGTALVGVGIEFVKDLIMDNGEELVKEGIKKVTGIDLGAKKPHELTHAEIESINKHKKEIMQLDFEKVKLDFEKIQEQNRHEEMKYATAHSTYIGQNDMADDIAKQIIKRNLPIVAILVLVNVALVYFMKNEPSLIAIASNIIGVAIGNLFNERQAIVNFFFGSSIGSKENAQKIKAL